MGTNAFSPDEVKVYICTKSGTATKTGQTAEFTAHIENFSMTGGERETETIPVFGGQQYTRKTTRGELECSFDVVVLDNRLSAIWLGHSGTEYQPFGDITGSGLYVFGDVTAAAHYDPVPVKIIIEQVEGGAVATDGRHLRQIFKDARVTSFDKEMGVDGYLKGSITFNLNPEDYMENYTPYANGSALTAIATVTGTYATMA